MKLPLSFIAWPTMHVSIRLILRSPCISIVLSKPRPPIVFVIESLPLLSSISIVAEFISLVQVLHVLAHLTELDEVVANGAIYFASVNQEEELRLNSGVKVEFKLWGRICVHADMVELWVCHNKLFVVFLDLGTHWIPTGGEVE